MSNSNRHFQRKASYFGEDSTSGGHTVIMYGDSTGYYAKWGSSDNKWEVVGDSSQTGNLDLNGELTVAELITGTSAITATNTLTASSNCTVTGALDVTGNSSMHGTLTVAKTLTASSNCVVTGELEVTGNSTFVGSLTVKETFAGSSNATVAGTLGVTKTITASSALIIPLQTGTSDALNLPNHGISVVGATSSGVRMHVLAAPVAGVIKAITCVELGTTATDFAKVWTGSTNVFFGSSDNQISYGDVNLSTLLIGISATQWGIIANGGTLETYTT